MIRSATNTDAPWIAALWNTVIAETLFTFTTTLKTEAEMVDMIARNPLLVLDDGSGFATYAGFRNGPGYAATVEHTIILAPQSRGQGRGRSLLSALEDVARAEQKHVMVAGISGANPQAVAFHHALGFEQVGRMPHVGRKAGQWLDLVLMQKVLNAPDSASTSG